MSQQTPLNQWHREHGARIVDFAGWDMPIQYAAGAIEEHKLVRRASGLFDVSHMGQLIFQGPAAGAALNRIVSSNLLALGQNQSAYGLMCREDGGVIDDVFVYRLEEHWLVVVNAANRAKDAEWMKAQLASTGVRMEDRSDSLAMIAFQGPRAIQVMDLAVNQRARSGTRASVVSEVPRFGAATVELAGVPCTIGRTGYTGEDGVEIFAPSDSAVTVWEHLLEIASDNNVECGPVGLAARDSLRFEPGFPLYGHELTEEINPIQARLKWACDLQNQFIGDSAIRKALDEGVETRLATIKMTERGVPRQGHQVYYDGAVVGSVASGMYAPTPDAYCANVYLRSDLSKIGTQVEIEIRDKTKQAVVVKRPLYKPAYR